MCLVCLRYQRKCLQMLSCCRWQEEPPTLDPEAEPRLSTLHVGWQEDGHAECVFREVKDLEHYNFEIEAALRACAAMLSKSDLFVQTSFWRCWTWLFFIFPIDAATLHSEVVVDSTGLVQQGRVFATHRNSVSGQQLIRKEGTNATLEHMLKQHTKEPQEHFDLLVIIPASLQRDRSKLQTVRETWAKDIDSKTHLCQRCNSERTVKYLFMLGEEAVEENPQDDDVV
eukprot:symbB.v1.2.039780.t1/scaffold6776.1/size15619/1